MIYILDWYYKKTSMDHANNSAVLAGASKMVSNFNRLGYNFSNHAKRLLIDDVKKFIRNHVKENLIQSSKAFYREEIQNIVNNSNVMIAQQKNDLKNYSSLQNNIFSVSNNKIFYHLDVTTSYDYRLQLIENIFHHRYSHKILSFVPAMLTIDTGEPPNFLIELVLDFSASMLCGMDSDLETEDSDSVCQKNKNSKITALKNAVLQLLDAINYSNAQQQVYIGLIGYTTRVEKNIKPSWGTEKIRQYVSKDMDALSTGSTDSTPAMETAYRIVTADKKRSFWVNLFREKVTIPSLDFQKFIILLTDGENNKQKNDVDTIKICDKAKKNSVKIITISLNASPQGKIFLKKCGSSSEYHYDVKNNASLLRVFQDIFRVIVHNKYQVRVKG
ncbi:vWA domain-containing protein [Candidatus Liberibacter africanus]|uniref:vWA domain-containing protein n=1 Tax=Liberibacter africanus TaxID=34020 RepID=UPI001FCD8E21|nr:vWA domain-containing protein [Candidatus Liberibacter africanus]